MKIVWISNFNDDTVSERIHMEFLHPWIAKWMCDALKAKSKEYDTYYPTIKSDDYILWRGMADLVGD